MKSLVIGLMLLSASAFANFTGNFKGTGAVTSNIGINSACPVISFNLSHNSSLFTINKGIVKCGEGFDMEMEPTAANIVNGELIVEGRKIGTINDREIRIAFEEEDQGELVKYTINFTKVNGIIQYEQGAYSANYTIVVKGDMK